MTSTVETNVKGDVIISSPLLTPKANNDNNNESVPDEVEMQCLLFTKLANFFSNLKTSSPNIKSPFLIIFLIILINPLLRFLFLLFNS